MNQKSQTKNKLSQYVNRRFGSPCLITIIAGGLFLRLYRLGWRSLWFDEADVVLDSVGMLDSFKILKLHNPVIFYKVFIFYWRHICPYIQEWLLRLPSVIFGICAIILIYKLCLLLFHDSLIGIISSFLLS